MVPPDIFPTAADGLAKSLQDRVRRESGTCTEAGRRVAHALLGEYPMAGLETVARFARRAQTSGLTIPRFISRPGFDTCADFQDSLRPEIQARLQGPLSRPEVRPEPGGPGAACEHVARAMRRNIGLAGRDLRSVLPRAVALMSEPERNILGIGDRFIRMIAAYLHHYLRGLRQGVRLVRDSSAAWADDLLAARPGDIVVMLVFRRYQRDVVDFARRARPAAGRIPAKVR